MGKSSSQQPAAPSGNPLARTTTPSSGQPTGSFGGVSASNPMAAAFMPAGGSSTPTDPSNDQLWNIATHAPGTTYGGPGGSPSMPTAPSPSIQPPITQNAQAAPGNTPPPAMPNMPTTFDPSNAQLFPGGIASTMQQAQDSAYKQATGYLDPQFAEQENSLKSQLANQGIMEGSEAYNKSMDDFSRQKQFAYSQAENGAYGQGMTAENQVAQQLLQQMGFGTSQNIANIGANASMFGTSTQANTAANLLAEQHAQNQFANSMGLRTEDINELLLQQQNPLSMANMLTGGQSVQSPNFTSTPNSTISPTDIASIIAQATGQQNNVYNSQVGASNSANAGMAGIIAALLSDRRLKTNIKQIGMHECGVPLYSYNYATGEPGFGVLADELEQVRPDAVWSDENGLKVVNYAAISKVDD